MAHEVPDDRQQPPSLPDWGASSASRGGSDRPAQIGSLIARVLRDRLARGLNDPRVQGMVSILGVDVTADLANAVVRVSVLPDDRSRLTLSGLRSAAGHLAGEVRKATLLRSVPHLRFELDDSIKREAALYAALQRAQIDRGEFPSDSDAAEIAAQTEEPPVREDGADAPAPAPQAPRDERPPRADADAP